MNPLQQWKQCKLYSDFSGICVHRDTSSEELIASYLSESLTGQVRLMESILERNNMKRAIKRVIKNKGAPGVDGMTVRKIKRYLKRHWSKIEQALLEGTYSPMVRVNGLSPLEVSGVMLDRQERIGVYNCL
jgi:hypothetical protein